MGKEERGCIAAAVAEWCAPVLFFFGPLSDFFCPSDEPDEVTVVKQALIAHLDLDPRVTLGVLCDQILPAEESMVDPDELYMRDRLRTLVLAFLTGEAKEAIVERHTVPGSDGEDVLVEGLLAVGLLRAAFHNI
jgi:hypothetical protein